MLWQTMLKLFGNKKCGMGSLSQIYLNDMCNSPGYTI